MKTQFFKPIFLISYIFLLITLINCKDDDDDNPTPEQQLPPITQTGANTFGCLINGKLFIPRDGDSGLGGSGANAINFIAYGFFPNYISHKLDVNNFKDGKPINNFLLHIQNLHLNGVSEYVFQESNFQDGVDSPEYTHLYIRAFDEASGGFKWYGSYENSGSLTITRYDVPNRIVSGTFSGRLREAGGTAEVEISQGRFDIKWSTISDHPFP